MFHAPPLSVFISGLLMKKINHISYLTLTATWWLVAVKRFK